MKHNDVKKSLVELKLFQLTTDHCKKIKGGNGETSEDIVIVDIITT